MPDIDWPLHWRSVPLRAIFSRVKDVGHPEEEMLSVYRDFGVVPKLSRSDNFNKTAENRNIYQLVDSGWLIVNRMKAWQGSVGISSFRGIVSGHYLCFRPRNREDPRFLDYLVRSLPYTMEFARLSRGVRPNQIEIDNDGLGALLIHLPPLNLQRAIADFLDTETARIDALVTKKQRLAELVTERQRSAADVLLQAERGVPLRRVADVLPGYMFPSENFGPDADGPLLLRGINVSVGSVRWDDAVRLKSSSIVPKRYELANDDVVVGMDRPFISGGTRVARIDDKSRGALLVQRVCRVRAGSPSMAVIVEYVLRSRRFAAHVEPDLTGVSVPHLSDQQIGSIDLPLLSAEHVETVAAQLRKSELDATTVTVRLGRQTRVLNERRQALITAAVTGELEIPGVAA